MPRVRADLVIRNIGQLVTFAGHNELPVKHARDQNIGVIGGKGQSNLCVASSKGIISYVGNSSALPEYIETSSSTEVDARGSLVLPGFVDSHTHALFAGTRENELAMKVEGLSYLDIHARGGGIFRTVEDTGKATDEELIFQTRSRLDNMLSNGTTTFEIKTGYGLDLKSEIRLLETLKQISKDFDISTTLLSAHAIPEGFSKKRYIEQVVLPSIDVASERKLASFCDVFLEEGVFGVDETIKILAHAKSRGLGTKIHADEFSDLGGASLAAESGAVSADHLMHVSEKGINDLSKSSTISVLLPGTSLCSFSNTYAPARAMLKQGCAVALATDMSPNSWIESMQLIVSLGCFMLRMTPVESLSAATINGAHAIGRSKEIGSIEIGKQCDVVLYNLSRYEQVPYMLSSGKVSKVIKKGKIVKENQS
ncbi:MAG: imidazolonepropionase [Nitrososphaerales archaeon]